MYVFVRSPIVGGISSNGQSCVGLGKCRSTFYLPRIMTTRHAVSLLLVELQRKKKYRLTAFLTISDTDALSCSDNCASNERSAFVSDMDFLILPPGAIGLRPMLLTICLPPGSILRV